MSVENHIPPDDPAWCHERTFQTSVQCCADNFCNTRSNFMAFLPFLTGENVVNLLHL